MFQSKDNLTEVAYFDGVNFVVKERLDAINGEFPDEKFSIDPWLRS